MITKKNTCEVAVHFDKEITFYLTLILLLLNKFAILVTVIASMIVIDKGSLLEYTTLHPLTVRFE